MATEKQVRILMVTNILTAVLLIGGAIYYYTGKSDVEILDKATLFHCKEDASIDKDLVEYFLARKTVHPDSGQFIRLDSARDQFKRYHHPPRPNGVPYAYTLGIRKMQALLDNIAIKNRELKQQGDLDTLAGVRIYLTKRFTDVGHGRGKKKHTDVLLTAARLSGWNYIDIGDPHGQVEIKTNEDPLLLNTSSPCPDMCEDDGH